jgi:hypothetical protein
MYVADFDSNGSYEQLVTCYNGEKAYPMALRHDLVSVLPSLKKKYLKYESYQGQQVEQIFTNEQLAEAEKLEAYVLESSVFISEGGKGFVRKALPKQAQLSVMYGLGAGDYDEDGKVDVLLGGNLYEAKPEVGIYDGSYGLLLKGRGDGSFTPLPALTSGIFSVGAVRNITVLKNRNKQLVLFAKNNTQVQLVELDTHENK